MSPRRTQLITCTEGFCGPDALAANLQVWCVAGRDASQRTQFMEMLPLMHATPPPEPQSGLETASQLLWQQRVERQEQVCWSWGLSHVRASVTRSDTYIPSSYMMQLYDQDVNRRLREEQDAEYQQSLETDR